jgi:hypothetical protein
MWSDHDANFLRILASVLQNLKKISISWELFLVYYWPIHLDSSQALGQRFMVHLRCSFEWWIRWIFIAQCGGSSSFLLNVSTSD